MKSWHIISSKYPPQRGGIGFHTAHIASGLRKKGYKVHIWTSISPLKPSPSSSDNQNLAVTIEEKSGIIVHRVANQWDDATFSKIGKKISEIGGVLFLQYRPESFGSYWNYSVARFFERAKKEGVETRVLIHEPFSVPDFKFFKPKTWFAAFHQYFTLRKILLHSEKAYVTTSNWRRYLKPFAKTKSILTLPVPSNLQSIAEAQKARNLRKAFGSDAKVLVGTYSSFKEPEVLSILSNVVVKLLKKHKDWVWLALGRHSEEFAESLKDLYPEVSSRVQTSGEIDPQALSANLQACDIIFQPYHLGVNTRRTSVMAALFHAMPTVTSQGIRTEFIWKETRCVKMVEWDNEDGYIKEIESLARNFQLRHELSQAARLAYETCFSLEHNIRLLTSE